MAVAGSNRAAARESQPGGHGDGLREAGFLEGTSVLADIGGV